MFDAAAVGTAAFVCCPLGGTILIAFNYVRLRQAARAVLAVALGLILTALNVLIKRNGITASGSLDRLKFDAFEVAFLFALWSLTWYIAKEEQGEAVRGHVARGGQLGSRWTAFWVGIATLATFVAAAILVMYAYQYRKIAVIGTSDQVAYSGFATKANAASLGNALKSDGYFQGRGASVLLDKGIDGTIISFAVQDDVWNQDGMLSSFEELAREVAPTVGGLPVQVRMIDSGGNVKESSTVGEVNFDGKDGIYYEGSVSKAEAKELGRRFQSMGFFRGKGANVFLTRHRDEGTTLAFVIVREADPNMIGSFEQIVREVAPIVGGLPIDMRLVNPQLQVQKDEVMQSEDGHP